MRYDIYHPCSCSVPVPIMITGIPASGKTTLALALCDKLRTDQLVNVSYEKLDIIYRHDWSSDLLFFEIFKAKQSNSELDVVIYDGISIFKAVHKEPELFLDLRVVNAAFVVIHCSRIVATIRALKRHLRGERESYKDASALSILDGYLLRNRWIKPFNSFVSSLQQYRFDPVASFEVLSEDILCLF